jgi:hypothetical protein
MIARSQECDAKPPNDKTAGQSFPSLPLFDIAGLIFCWKPSGGKREECGVVNRKDGALRVLNGICAPRYAPDTGALKMAHG